MINPQEMNLRNQTDKLKQEKTGSVKHPMKAKLK